MLPFLSPLCCTGDSFTPALLFSLLNQKTSEWQNHFGYCLERPGVNLAGGEISIRILRLGVQQWHQEGKNAMLIKQLLRLMVKTWGCLSKRIPGISGILHFVLEPGWSVSKKCTFFYWRSNGEARTVSSIISLDPYNNPLETYGGYLVWNFSGQLIKIHPAFESWIICKIYTIVRDSNCRFIAWIGSHILDPDALPHLPPNTCCSWTLGSAFRKGWAGSQLPHTRWVQGAWERKVS